MKTKLGNFIEVFGIFLGVSSIAGFIYYLIKTQYVFAIILLIVGITGFVFSLAISQMLFSIEQIEEDTSMMSQRMQVLEELNREAVSKDLFSGNPKKSVNIPQRRQGVAQAPQRQAAPTQAPVQSQQSMGAMGVCYKCGYKGPFTGNNFCPKCGNHSFYQ